MVVCSKAIRIIVGTSFLLAAACLGAVKTVATPGELTSAVSSASPGDTLIMKDGSWGAFSLNGKGAENNPVVVTAQTPGKVMMTGSISLAGQWLTVSGVNYQGVKSGQPLVIFQNADHCRVTNSAFVNCSAPDRWFHFRLPGTYNRFDHNYVSGMHESGQTVQVEVDPKIPNYHRLDHNFFGNRPQGNGNGFETFRIGYSHQQFNISRTTVDHSLFYKCDGENEVISSKSCENRYLYNTLMNCRGHLANRHGSRSWIEGNFFIGNEGGVRVIDSGHVLINNYFEGNSDFGIMIYKGVATSDVKSYKQVVGGLIAFNTFVNNGIQVGGGGGGLLPRDVKIANNIAYGSATFVSYLSNPTNFSYEGNMGNAKAGNATGFTTKDPMLSKGADGVYRPADGSPAKDAAVGVYDSIPKDLNGWMRDAKKDVGNFEIGAGTIQSKPLTEKDVGPTWMGNPYNPGDEDGIVAVRLAQRRSRSAQPAFQSPAVRVFGTVTGAGHLDDLLGRNVGALVAGEKGLALKPAAGAYVSTPGQD
jgi:poly(beta-D-mannuronate) lyase